MSSFYLIKPYFKKHSALIFTGLSALIIVDMLQLYIPRIVKKAIDSLTVFDTDFNMLFKYAFSIVFIGFAIATLRYIWRRCLIGLSRYIERELRARIFQHIQTLSPSFFSRNKTGDLMSHATNDLNHIRMATGMGLVALTDGLFLGTCSIGFMIYINPVLTMYALIPMPFIFLVAFLMSKRMHKSYQETQAVFSNLTEKVREFFSGIRVVKSYQIQNFTNENINSVSKEYVKKNLILTAMTGALFPLMMMISNLSTGIVLLVGGKLTILNTISTGDFVAFMSYLGLLVWPMMAVGWVTNLIQRGRASLDRLDVILRTEPEISDNKKNTDNYDLDKNPIIFKNVGFRYPDQKKSVLSDINMIIEPGKVTGIAGPPGSGKTTILKLIPRLFDVSGGSISINGYNIKEQGLKYYRNRFSFMEQEPFMFSGSIRENITFGIEFPENELEIILKKACLLDAVKNLPNGLETVIGEKGIILSGGQKQRVAFARALIKENAVMILDDPVSQVDTKTTSEIINTIYGLKTVVITSHRFSALKNADIIYILENGKITDFGKHDELMEKSEYYSKTFEMQTIIEAGI